MYYFLRTLPQNKSARKAALAAWWRKGTFSESHSSGSVGVKGYLWNLAIAPSLKPLFRFRLARDLAFFSVDFLSGKRGSDLGQVKRSDILVLQMGNASYSTRFLAKFYEVMAAMFLALSLFLLLLTAR